MVSIQWFLWAWLGKVGSVDEAMVSADFLLSVFERIGRKYSYEDMSNTYLSFLVELLR